MVATSMQIGQVARKTGLSVDAIRFYEKAGLLTRPARTQSGYRLYQEREVADLEFIQRAQQLGFSLNEIRELFSIQRDPHGVCIHVRDLIGQKLSVVRTKIAVLQRLETDLDGSCGDAARLFGGRRSIATRARCWKRLREPTRKGRTRESRDSLFLGLSRTMPRPSIGYARCWSKRELLWTCLKWK